MNTFGQQLVTLIEGDLVQQGGAPLVTLITDLQKGAGNNLAQAAAVMKFTASAPAAGIALEVELEQQLLQLALTKLTAAMTPAPATPAAGNQGMAAKSP